MCPASIILRVNLGLLTVIYHILKRQESYNPDLLQEGGVNPNIKINRLCGQRAKYARLHTGVLYY